MFFATIEFSIEFFVYTQSSLNNLYSFGLIIVITIIMSLLADILLAPALIALIYRNQETKSKKKDTL